ncbi:MAG: YfiM family protein, partial [Bacteroidia bacterium]|nr:YfiM family protein [Bacteroidia bacterium]
MGAPRHGRAACALFAVVATSCLCAKAQKVEYTQTELFLRKEEFFNVRKARLAAAFWGVSYAATTTALGAAWYGGERRAPFHLFDDNRQWKQIDKWGHAYAAFQFSHAAMETAKWTGCERKTVLWTASAGFAILLPIEIFDGFMEKYGASVGDLAANAAGSALALINEAVWKRPRILLKVGFFPTDYARLRPDLLGRNFAEQLLKD